MKLVKPLLDNLQPDDYKLIHKTRKSHLNEVVIHHLGIPVDLQILAVLEPICKAYKGGLVRDAI